MDAPQAPYLVTFEQDLKKPPVLNDFFQEEAKDWLALVAQLKITLKDDDFGNQTFFRKILISLPISS